MPTENNPINIALRSEDVQDILSRPPHWMISWGNTVLIILVFLVFALSYFIKYPDVIEGRALISTTTPPVFVSTKVSGRISQVHTANGQSIVAGEVIAEIDNPVPLASINFLKVFLEEATAYLNKPISGTLKNMRVDLFDATGDYLALQNVLSEYKNYLFEKEYDRKLNDLRKKLSHHKSLKEINLREASLTQRDVKNAKEKFKMQEEEYRQGLTSRLAFLGSQSEYNRSLRSEETIRRSLIQADLTLMEYQAQLQDFMDNRARKLTEFRANSEALITNLQNYVVNWEKDFIIRAPISGKVDYQGRVKTNQLVSAGTELFAVVPPGGVYEVEVKIPVAGFGKVKVGQAVKLKLDNFPSSEYGIISGTVTGLPILPDEGVYTIRVKLEMGLKTNYGRQLQYSPEMTSSAEVITEDLRLIQRLFASLRAIL